MPSNSLRLPSGHGIPEQALPVLIRSMPAGFNWGFYSSEEPRMHLQTLPGAEPHKIWLETQGRWSIDKCGKVPTKIFNALKRTLEAEPLLAWRVRAEWVRQMMAKHWLELRVSGHEAMVTAYPRTPHAFERAIDLREHARPALYANGTKDVRLDEETASLMIGSSRPEHSRVLVNLADVLWETAT
jgi:hypothetical protein